MNIKTPFKPTRIVLLVGGLIAFGMFLFPPYMEIYPNAEGAFTKASLGYHFILTPPVSTTPKTTQGVIKENSRLAPHIALLAIATFIAHEIAKRGEKRESSEKNERP